MTVAYDPESIGRLVYPGSDSAVDLIEEVGISAKLERISELVGFRLEKAVESAKDLRDSESTDEGAFAKVRPWSGSELPHNVILRAERHAYANDRIVGALMSHLVEHIAYGEEISSIASAARRRAIDELNDVPKLMIGFVNLIMAAGVTAADVKYVSRKKLASIVSIIKGEAIDDDLTGLIDQIPQGAMGDPNNVGDDAGRSVDGLDEMGLGGRDEAAPNTVRPPDPAPVTGTAELQPGATKTTSDALSDPLDGSVSGTGSDDGKSASDSASGTPDDVSQTAPGGVDRPDGSAESSGLGTPANGDSETGAGGRDSERGNAPDRPASDSSGSAPDAASPGMDAGVEAGVDGSSGGGSDASADGMPATVEGASKPAASGGRWDVLDMSGLGYRIEEKLAETDDEMRALRYALPEVASILDLAAPGSSEVPTSTSVVHQKDRVLAGTFFSRWGRRTKTEMTEEQRRIWMLLTVEMPYRATGRKLGDDGFFDGLLMPGPKGSARVRKLVAEDRNPAKLTKALKR